MESPSSQSFSPEAAAAFNPDAVLVSSDPTGEHVLPKIHATHDVVYSGYQLFPFETSTTVPQFSSFCARHDVVPWVGVTVYMIFVFFGLKIMKKKPAFSFRVPLILWNVALASFSIFGTFRMQQEFKYTYQNAGSRGTYCTRSMDNVVGFWIFVFVMSKFVEFGDTVFLVLRKKPVIFLHWYHHVTVLLFSYYTAIDWSPNGRWFVTMNFFVHSLMYSYYALQAAGIRAAKPFALPLTMLQTVQMFAGMYVITLSAIEANRNFESCPNSWRTIISGFLMYASYFVLFLKFFLKSYVFNSRKGADAAISIRSDMDGVKRKSGLKEQ